jgi:hypothetical protein
LDAATTDILRDLVAHLLEHRLGSFDRLARVEQGN